MTFNDVKMLPGSSSENFDANLLHHSLVETTSEPYDSSENDSSVNHLQATQQEMVFDYTAPSTAYNITRRSPVRVPSTKRNTSVALPSDTKETFRHRCPCCGSIIDTSGIGYHIHLLRCMQNATKNGFVENCQETAKMGMNATENLQNRVRDIKDRISTLNLRDRISLMESFYRISHYAQPFEEKTPSSSNASSSNSLSSSAITSGCRNLDNRALSLLYTVQDRRRITEKRRLSAPAVISKNVELRMTATDSARIKVARNKRLKEEVLKRVKDIGKDKDIKPKGRRGRPRKNEKKKSPKDTKRHRNKTLVN